MLQKAGQAEDIPSGPSAWCCSVDADVRQLLTPKEEKRYLQNSLKAAARSRGDLVTCPRPKCEGMAVTTQGEAVCHKVVLGALLLECRSA